MNQKSLVSYALSNEEIMWLWTVLKVFEYQRLRKKSSWFATTVLCVTLFVPWLCQNVILNRQLVIILSKQIDQTTCRKISLIWCYKISSWKNTGFLDDWNTSIEFCFVSFLSVLLFLEVSCILTASLHLKLNSCIYWMGNVGNLPKGFFVLFWFALLLFHYCQILCKEGISDNIKFETCWISLGLLKTTLQYHVEEE